MIKLYATTDVDSIRPYMPRDVSYMLPASSFYRKGFPTPKLPAGVDVAADCGGYVMTKKYGTFPYGIGEYDTWLETIPGLRWAAMFDYCCEDDLISPEDGMWSAPVGTRQGWTTEHAQTLLEYFGHRPWAWVPTVQGWDLDDYRRHAEQLAPLVFELQRWYLERQNYDYFGGDESDPEACAAFEATWRAANDFRVGIGTLCRRASPTQIKAIVNAVSEVLPGVPLHLWGVKYTGLIGNDVSQAVVSCDTAAWNRRFGSNIELQRNSGLTQREYGYKVALRYYMDRFETAVNGRRYSKVPARPVRT